MFISPIARMDGISSLDPIGTVQELGTPAARKQKNDDGPDNSLFKNMLMDAVQNVKETSDKVAEDQYLLSTGQLDDVHTMTIDSTKAELSLSLLLQIRTKALEAYNELIRTNL